MITLVLRRVKCLCDGKGECDGIVVRDFEESDAAGVAKLLNESEEGWPSGFTGGIPFTPERVLEDVRRHGALAHLVITLNDEIVGVCDVSEHWHEKGVAYVSFLNVHPKHHGKGFGKRLLLEGIKRSIDWGAERLDIHTWSGNMKAVPLYKKTGFFWMPKTSVYMQNYVPAILRFPLATEFFGRHPDWYGCFKRALEVEEDDLKEKGMSVFIYNWEEGEEKLRVVVDREAFSIAGIENDKIGITCWPMEHLAPAGIPQKITWRIENKSGREIQCSLLVTGEEGIRISKSPPEFLTIKPAQVEVLDAEVMVDPKTMEKDRHEAAHKIETKLFVNGRLVPIAIGLRVKQAVELSFDPPYFSGYPGSQGKLKIVLKNNVKQPVRGVVSVVPQPMVQVSPPTQDFAAPKEGYAGVTFDVTISENAGNSALPLRCYATLEVERRKVKTREKLFYVKSFEHGGVLATLEKDGKNLILENEVARVVIGLHRGGRLHSLHGKLLETHYLSSLFDAIGPPFWPTELDRKDFNYEIHREDGTIRARIYTDLETYKGLRIIKDITLFPSTELVKVQYTFVNSRSTAKHDFQLRVGTRANFGHARLILPFKGGILSAPMNGDFPKWEADLPEDPKSLSETWCCIELAKTGEVSGLLWHPQGVVKNKFGGAELIIKPRALEPQYSVTLNPMYLVGGFGTWRKVRELWRRLIEGQTRKEILYREPRTQPLVEAKLEPSIMEVPRKTKAEIKLINRRGKALSGNLTLRSPKGWSITPRRLKFKDIRLEKPLEKTVIILPPKETLPGPYQGKVRVSTNLSTVESPFQLIVLGRMGVVQVERREEEGREVFCVDNGRLVLKVCPGFAGTAYSLIDKERGVDHLLSSFPEPKPYGYEKPWFGGMRFAAWKTYWRGKLHEEEFQCEKIERNGWTGVRVFTAPVEKQKDLKGMLLQCTYLTKPDSNVIARVLHLENKTTARMEFRVLQDAFLRVGGSVEDNVVYFQKNGEVMTRKRTRYMAWVSSDQRWLQVTNEKTDDSLVVVSTASERSDLGLQDWAKLGVNLTVGAHAIVDHETPLEILSFLVATKGSEAYKKYRCLEDYSL